MNKYLYVFSLLIFLTSTYFYKKVDSKCYYYGCGSMFYQNVLPNNISPNYYELNFTLIDEDGYEIIGNSFIFENSNFEIKEILSYGYNNKKIIVKCESSSNKYQYFISYETRYKNLKSHPEISFKEISNNYVEKNINKFNWINLDKNIRENLVSIRMKYGLLILVSFICIII